MRTEVLCISVLRVASGPRVKLAGDKSALNSRWFYSHDLYKAVVPVLVLVFVALWFYSARRFVLRLALCYFVIVFFSPFSIVITSLGEERAKLSAFCTFARIALVLFCLFPLPLGVWEGLRLEIVALSGLFSYLFSSPEHEVLMVSYYGQSMSVVRRASSVVRRTASTIALKAYSSYTPRPIDSILCRKHQGDF